MVESIEENPDIGDIDDVFITFTLDAHTQESSSIEYMMAFFTDLEKEGVIIEPEFSSMRRYHDWKTGAVKSWGDESPAYFYNP